MSSNLMDRSTDSYQDQQRDGAAKAHEIIRQYLEDHGSSGAATLETTDIFYFEYEDGSNEGCYMTLGGYCYRVMDLRYEKGARVYLALCKIYFDCMPKQITQIDDGY